MRTEEIQAMRMEDIRAQAQIIRNALQLTENVHQEVVSEVNLKNPNKVLALYILGGRAITLSYSAVVMLENAHLAEMGALIRMIEETAYLEEYFNDIAESSKKLRNWLNNEILAPKIARRAQGRLFTRIFGRRNLIFDKKINELYHILSEYVHPTYGISKMNMNEVTLVFDYQWINYQRNDIPIFTSVASAVVTVLNMFIYCREFYQIADNKYDQLLEQRNLLMNLDI